MRYFIILVLSLVAICQAVNPPVFPEQYSAHGVILLPYAELREPFAGYYDGVLNRSRIDYYGDLMITLQKSQVAEKDTHNQYGNNYKIVYEAFSSGETKRVCFKSSGNEKEIVTAQSLLPNLDGFTRIGTVRCPIENINEFKEGELRSKVRILNRAIKSAKHSNSCELWRKKDVVGEKASTYSFWFRYDKNTHEPIPVTYEMSGYNTLLGSHYDHYILHYTNFRDGLISEDLFNINEHYGNCGPYPGPGATRKLGFNPIRAYFDSSRKLYDEDFDEFKDKTSKQYNDGFEHEKRKKIFLDNTRFILAMNRRNPTYQLDVNHLADKSEDELEILRGRTISLIADNGGLPFESKRLKSSNENLNDDTTLPSNWDWRLLEAVNPVKDQAICGSCWSFGTTGTLEGAYFVKTGHLIRLSEQQLIDCSWDQGNNGCDGGEDFRVYRYLLRSGGLALEDDYGHYLGVDGRCHANTTKKTLKISGFVNVTQYNIEDLKQALYENGPITIAINAGVKTFSFYSNGIYDDPACLGDPNHLNHQVLLVGYGTLGGKDYWLVKNSWSTYWGNSGYVLIAQKDNICGVTTLPSYPIIEL